MRGLTEVMEGASKLEPLTLAILFLGLIGLAVIGLAALAISTTRGDRRNER